jgi:hypothetical protein
MLRSRLLYCAIVFLEVTSEEIRFRITMQRMLQQFPVLSDGVRSQVLQMNHADE